MRNFNKAKVFTHTNFTNKNIRKIQDWVNDHIDELELKKGWNYNIDVSDVLQTTANVDIKCYNYKRSK